MSEKLEIVGTRKKPIVCRKSSRVPGKEREGKQFFEEEKLHGDGKEKERKVTRGKIVQWKEKDKKGREGK